MKETFYQYVHNNWLLAISTPIYVVLISLEVLLSVYRKKQYYTLKESLINLWLNIANAVLGLSIKALVLVFLAMIGQYQIAHVSNEYLYWIVLFFCVDFSFYVEHSCEHFVRLFWAVHVTHHSSQEFNLTTGFRSSVFRPLVNFWFYIPWVLLGFHPLDILLVDAICQIYGILVHTQFVRKMPKWFEAVCVSPAHHRVHHASNIEYLDKNMGMCLIIWDKIFGTFQPELDNVKTVFGLTKNPENPHHPLQIIFHEWQAIGKDLSKKGTTFRQKLQYLYMPPGWSHDGTSQTAKQMRAKK